MPDPINPAARRPGARDDPGTDAPGSKTANPAADKVQSARHGTAILLALMWITGLWATADLLRADSCQSDAAPARCRVDPNVAPWFELTVLPRIGETTARTIVRYRASVRDSTAIDPSRAFSNAGDLARVRGIGPITVHRIAPYLQFD